MVYRRYMKKFRFATGKAFGILLIVWVALVILLTYVTDWWWFTEIGFTTVFLTSLTARLVLWAAVTAVSAAILIANVFIATKSGVMAEGTSYKVWGDSYINKRRLLRLLGLGGSLAVACLFGLIAAASWQEVLLWLNAVPFGQLDPIFNRDIGWYIFTWPVVSGAAKLLRGLLFVGLISSGAMYLALGKLSLVGLLGKLGARNLARFGVVAGADGYAPEPVPL